MTTGALSGATAGLLDAYGNPIDINGNPITPTAPPASTTASTPITPVLNPYSGNFGYGSKTTSGLGPQAAVSASQFSGVPQAATVPNAPQAQPASTVAAPMANTGALTTAMAAPISSTQAAAVAPATDGFSKQGAAVDAPVNAVNTPTPSMPSPANPAATALADPSSAQMGTAASKGIYSSPTAPAPTPSPTPALGPALGSLSGTDGADDAPSSATSAPSGAIGGSATTTGGTPGSPGAMTSGFGGISSMGLGGALNSSIGSGYNSGIGAQGAPAGYDVGTIGPAGFNSFGALGPANTTTDPNTGITSFAGFNNMDSGIGALSSATDDNNGSNEAAKGVYGSTLGNAFGAIGPGPSPQSPANFGPAVNSIGDYSAVNPTNLDGKFSNFGLADPTGSFQDQGVNTGFGIGGITPAGMFSGGITSTPAGPMTNSVTNPSMGLDANIGSTNAYGPVGAAIDAYGGKFSEQAPQETNGVPIGASLADATPVSNVSYSGISSQPGQAQVADGFGTQGPAIGNMGQFGTTTGVGVQGMMTGNGFNNMGVPASSVDSANPGLSASLGGGYADASGSGGYSSSGGGFAEAGGQSADAGQGAGGTNGDSGAGDGGRGPDGAG